MNFIAKTFDELTNDELYEIIRSRAEVFLLEQNIICQDLDGKDRCSVHCFFFDNNRVVAYLRVFPADDSEVIIGRVLTLEHGNGLGRELMSKSMETIRNRFGNTMICVHAQKQAVGFYEKMGFVSVSAEYLEEGIPHITMKKSI